MSRLPQLILLRIITVNSDLLITGYGLRGVLREISCEKLRTLNFNLNSVNFSRAIRVERGVGEGGG